MDMIRQGCCLVGLGLFLLVGCSTTPQLSTREKNRIDSKQKQKRHKEAGRRLLERKDYVGAWNEFYEIRNAKGMRKSLLGAIHADYAWPQVKTMIQRFRRVEVEMGDELTETVNRMGRTALENGRYRKAWFLYESTGNQEKKRVVLNHASQEKYDPEWIRERENELNGQ